MISAFFKILSVAILLTGLLAIMVIKNISAEKQKYINELELTLREEQKINELYKIEWDHLVSPMNIKKISEMIITNDYEKYFVVLDNEDIEENNELFNDVIEVYETSTINQNIIRKLYIYTKYYYSYSMDNNQLWNINHLEKIEK